MPFYIVVTRLCREYLVNIEFVEWAIISEHFKRKIYAHVCAAATRKHVVQYLLFPTMHVPVEVVTAVVTVVPVGYGVVGEDGLLVTDLGDVDFVGVAKGLLTSERLVVVAHDVDNMATGDPLAILLWFDPREIAEDVQLVIASYVFVEGTKNGIVVCFHTGEAA